MWHNCQMQANNKTNELWSKNLRTLIFFAIYQSIFNQSIGLEYEIRDFVVFLKSVSTEYPELFASKAETEHQDEFEKNLELEITKDDLETMIHSLAVELEEQMKVFYKEHSNMTIEIKEHLTDYLKTFGIVKALLYCFLLEKRFTDNNSDFAIKGVSLYIKLAEEFTILANIKLIHAILSKIQG
jgi:hypothetical protein